MGREKERAKLEKRRRKMGSKNWFSSNQRHGLRKVGGKKEAEICQIETKAPIQESTGLFLLISY